MTHEITYCGRQGRRTPTGYKIFHIVSVDGQTYEIKARTRDAAEMIAMQQAENAALSRLSQQ